MFGYGKTTELKEELRQCKQLIKSKCTVIKVLEEELKQRGKKKYRKQLSHRTGYTKVSPEESIEMFERYNEGFDISEIANAMNRTSSCVGKHIRKQLEESEDERTV